MSVQLDPNTWYRIFYSSLQAWVLTALEINASKSAGVLLQSLGTTGIDGADDWQVIPVDTAQNTFAFRSRKLGDDSYLAVFSPAIADTRARVDMRNLGTGDDDIPPEGQWSLVPSKREEGEDDSYYLRNAANGTTYLLDHANGILMMEDDGNNLTAAGKWTFVGNGVVTSISAVATTSSESESADPLTSATTTPDPATSSISTSPSLDSGGAIAGVTIGAISGFLLLCILASLLFRRKRRTKPATELVGKQDGMTRIPGKSKPQSETSSSELGFSSCTQPNPVELDASGQYRRAEMYQHIPRELETIFASEPAPCR